MTKRDLLKALQYYPMDSHVVVAVMPTDSLIVRKDGIRLELRNVCADAHGVTNIIAVEPCSEVDPTLHNENNL